MTVALLNTFLSALYDISNKHETLRDRPLKGIYQMLKLVTVSVGIVLIIGILIDRNATSILAGLGASAAVLMLIFKDSILGARRRRSTLGQRHAETGRLDNDE